MLNISGLAGGRGLETAGGRCSKVPCPDIGETVCGVRTPRRTETVVRLIVVVEAGEDEDKMQLLSVAESRRLKGQTAEIPGGARSIEDCKGRTEQCKKPR